MLTLVYSGSGDPGTAIPRNLRETSRLSPGFPKVSQVSKRARRNAECEQTAFSRQPPNPRTYLELIDLAVRIGI
jgi:hypothetical protein